MSGVQILFARNSLVTISSFFFSTERSGRKLNSLEYMWTLTKYESDKMYFFGFFESFSDSTYFSEPNHSLMVSLLKSLFKSHEVLSQPDSPS